MSAVQGNHGCGMSMEFHFGVKETILFGPWAIETVGGLIGSMVAIVAMAFVYEYLKTFVVRLQSKKLSSSSESPSKWSSYHLNRTLLHGVQVILGNLIMLIVMTYNVWLCLAVLIGAVIGYFLFGLERGSSDGEACGCH